MKLVILLLIGGFEIGACLLYCGLLFGKIALICLRDEIDELAFVYWAEPTLLIILRLYADLELFLSFE